MRGLGELQTTPSPLTLRSVLAERKAGFIMATHVLGSSVITRDCDVCGQELAISRFIVTEPLVWTTSTMVGADCYLTHRRGVDLALARDRSLVCTEVVA